MTDLSRLNRRGEVVRARGARRVGCSLLLGIVLSAVTLLGAPSNGVAQVDELAGRCVLVGTADAASCHQYALATQLVQSGLGLTHAGGNAFQGSVSTLGRRFGATPRVAVSVRGALTRFPVARPDGGLGDIPAQWANVPSLHGQFTVGVFDGFSTAPTVGGLLSFDLLATADIAFLPDTRGFADHSSGWGYGMRLGVIRESFTLPGITLSATRKHGGSVDFVSPGVVVSLEEVKTTSLRAVVGKEFMIGGLLAGAGWDRYSSEGEMRYAGPSLGTDPPPTPLDGFHASRMVLFGGWSKTFLVLQISGEVGWARGFERASPLITGFDPGTGSAFGSFSLRLTL